ncbi:MAG TPA: ABC transporter permease [Terriglobales bacterium]|nr:ABC transporter permease [Terriglobales bacterium]
MGKWCSAVFAALIWRPLRNDVWRTALSVAAIALGVAVVIAIRVANRDAVGSFERSAASLAGGADLMVTGPQPLPATLLPRLARLGRWADFAPYLDRRVVDLNHDDTLEILGIDLLAARQTPPRIYLSPSYWKAHDLRAGETLRLVIGGREQRFAAEVWQPSGRARLASNLAVTDLADALAAFEPNTRESAAQFDGLRITLAPGVGAGAVTAGVRALIPAVDRVGPPQDRVTQQARMLSAFRANLAALSYVSLLVGIFLIYNTVSISVVRRRASIATLRALGATRGRVLRLFLIEGAALAVVGGALGLIIGWLLANAALAVIERTINNLFTATSAAQAALIPADALWAIGLALWAGVLAAWAPAWQAARQAPAQAIRAGTAEAAARQRTGLALALAALLGAAAVGFAALPEPGATPWFAFLCALAAVLALASLAPPLLAGVLPRMRRMLLAARRLDAGLAAGGLAGALRRSSVLTVAVATAIGVMLGVAIMVGSFRQTVNVWLGEQLQADVFIRSVDWDRDRPAPLDPAVVAAAAELPGVMAVEASHSQIWEYAGAPVSINTRWSLGARSSRKPVYQMLDGEEGPAMVSEPLARRAHLRVGEPLTLAAPSGPLTTRVAGIFYDYASDRGLIVLDRATFDRGFGPPAVTELGLDAAPGVSPAALSRRLELKLAEASGVTGRLATIVNDNQSLRREAMGVFDQTFRITYALAAITLLVAILGVGNTLLAVVLEREREFAILRALGASRGQVRDILLAEAGLLGSLALALGWAMGLVLAVILVRVINVQSFGWTIQFHLPWAFLLPASAAVWLATLAAGWLPARAAQRQVTPQALAVE